jgi:hypothetical protein
MWGDTGGGIRELTVNAFFNFLEGAPVKVVHSNLEPLTLL